MKTKLLAMGLSVCLLASLCACGSGVVASSGDGGTVSSSGGDNSDPEVSSSANSEAKNANRTQIRTSYGASGEVYYWIESRYGGDGKLESVTSYRADGSESGHVDITYDEHGNKLTDYGITGIGQSRLSDGVLPWPNVSETTGSVNLIQYEYEYTVSGELIKKTKTSYDRTQEIEEYDEDGNVIRNTRIAGQTQVVTEYVYNNISRLMNSYCYLYYDGEIMDSYGYRDLFNGLSPKMFYEYDSNGALVSIKSYDENDDLIKTTLRQYDTNGNLFSVETYDQNGDLTENVLYQYDSNGHQVLMESYLYLSPNSEATLSSHIEYEYTVDGKISKISQNPYSKAGLERYTLYYYDEQGETSAYEVYFASGGQEALFERVEYTYK